MDSSFLSSDLGRLIAAGVLTPVLGLVGTKVKELVEARDVRQQSKRLMDEVASLLEFTDTLQKAANSGGALAKVPSESLENLQAAIAERIKMTVAYIAPPSAVRIQERHLTRDIFDRLFLLHRPLVWWAWPLHALYYGLVGILAMASIAVVSDFQSNANDKWDGVYGVILFVILAIILNLFANLADRRKSRSIIRTSDAT